MNKKASIFIVEDELIVADDIRETLKNMGYSVLGIAKSGEEALEKVKELHPELVLMDIHLAGNMDGIETAGLIHTQFDIPVIYLTAYADNNLLERAKVTEPYGYILKPYNDREIQSVIEMALYKHQMAGKLKERDRTIEALLNTTPDAMLLLDNNGNVLSVNGTMAERLKKKPKDLLQMTINDLLSTGAITVQLAEAERAVRSGKPASFIEEVNNRSFENNLYPVFDSKESVTKIAVYSHDITAIKAAERELGQLNEQLLNEKEELIKFTAAIDCMDDRVIITDHTGTIEYLNQSAERMLGYQVEEIKGRHISEFKAPESKFAIDKGSFLTDSKSVWSGSMIFKNKYGLKISTSLTSSPVGKENRIISRVFVFREQH
jgi:PAS domain S-box-containing protein